LRWVERYGDRHRLCERRAVRRRRIHRSEGGHASWKWRQARGRGLRNCNRCVSCQRTSGNDDLAAARLCDRAARRADTSITRWWRWRRVVAAAAITAVTSAAARCREREQHHETCTLAAFEQSHDPPREQPICPELRRLRRIADTAAA